jgi:hypothetical protein
VASLVVRRRSLCLRAGTKRVRQIGLGRVRASTPWAEELLGHPRAHARPSPRGGAYTYDWIENLLGLDMHSADRVLPELQHPKAGDTIGFGKNRLRLEVVEPGQVLAWRSEDGNWVWTFVLREHDGKTRLISRNRFRLPTLTARIGMLPMEPASLLMERKMLRGIKERAERLATTAASHELELTAAT